MSQEGPCFLNANENLLGKYYHETILNISSGDNDTEDVYGGGVNQHLRDFGNLPRYCFLTS